MDDLIRRQDALDDAFTLEYAFCHHEAVKLYYEHLKGALERIPAVDAVEVIRCENCIMHNDCKFEQYQGLNGFCSLGERKENGK